MNNTSFQIYGNTKNINLTWDTLSTTSSNNVFNVRRASDNVVQDFTYNDITSGTYDTFLSGSDGYITKWYGDKLILSNTNNTWQPKLLSNSGNPYNYSYIQGTSLTCTHNLIFQEDWIVTVVLNGEENSNNQRANLTIASTTEIILAFQIATSSVSTYATFLYKKNVNLITGNMTPDLKFNISNPSFKLITFKYVGGVLEVYINNALVTLTSATADAYTIGMAADDINKIDLGASRGGGNIGKINKYKHLSIISSPDLSSFNLSSYNLEIMTKYAI